MLSRKANGYRYIYGTAVIIACIAAIIRDNKTSQIQSEQEENRVFHDKVVYTTDKSPNHKTKDLIFASGETCPFSHMEFNDLVLPGDSIAKPAGSFIYTIYRPEKNDTVAFDATRPHL